MIYVGTSIARPLWFIKDFYKYPVNSNKNIQKYSVRGEKYLLDKYFSMYYNVFKEKSK